MAIKPKRNYPNLGPRSPREKGKTEPYKGHSILSAPYLVRRISQSWRQVISPPGAVFVVDNSSSMPTVGVNVIKTFTYNKDWKTRVAKGIDATSAYSRAGVRHCYGVTYGGETTQFKTEKSWGHGLQYGSTLVDAKDDSALNSAAIGRLKNKLNGYIGSAQLAAPLAESREIHRLVRQINGLGMDTLKALLSIRKSGGKSIVKHAADIWLGFGFGVNPLLHDVQSAAEAISSFVTRDDQRVRVTGSANRDWQTTGFNTPVNPTSHCTLKITSSAKHKQGVRIVAGVDLKLKAGSSYSVTDHLGLKVTDLPSVLWELTPYSWAVDYFATVSPWLDDMFYTLPGVCKYVSLNRKYELETTWLPSIIYGSSVTGSVSCSAGFLEYFTFSREVLTALPTRGLRVKSLDEIAQHGVTKLLNLASVLAGRMK